MGIQLVLEESLQRVFEGFGQQKESDHKAKFIKNKKKRKKN